MAEKEYESNKEKYERAEREDTHRGNPYNSGYSKPTPVRRPKPKSKKPIRNGR
jgi:hypothetical protein